jgi:6-phosphogluconolactonase
MMSASILVCDDRDEIAQRAADLLLTSLDLAIAARGEGHMALTGGSSASALFETLRRDEHARRLDWGRVHVWQGDERVVRLDHPDSNWAVALREWLDHADGPAVPETNRHPVEADAAVAGGHGPEWAAERYGAEVEQRLPRRHGLSGFDVVLLGVGGDGHILSVFPRSAALTEDRRAAVAVPAPEHIEPHLPRVTLAPRLLEAAGQIIVMVPGAAKADIVADCLGPVRDSQRWPAQLALLPTAVWLLEPESAARL